MKKEFWLCPMATLFIWPFFGTIYLTVFIVGIILTFINSECWPIILCGIILIPSSVYGIFIKEETLTKVIFSEDEICLKRFNKLIKAIKWSDVVQISGGYYGRALSYMSFISNNEKINVVPTKKMYETILYTCPYNHLKNMIENIKQFKWFHRK